MGNEKYLTKIIRAVQHQGINDQVVYELVPDLIYTRKNPAFDVALEILFETEKRCMSSSPDNPRKIQCGYRVMEYLAPVIMDFPYQVKSSGDLDTDDYSQALTVVRKWFLEKGNTYKIIDNRF
jgi:hypothetical protein